MGGDATEGDEGIGSDADAGGDRRVAKEDEVGGQTPESAETAGLRDEPNGNAGLPGRFSQGLGHWLRSDRGDVQKPDAATEAPGDEMGPGPRGGDDEPDRPL